MWLPILATFVTFIAFATLPLAAADPPDAKPRSASSLADSLGGGTLDLDLRGYFMDMTLGEAILYPKDENEA